MKERKLKDTWRLADLTDSRTALILVAALLVACVVGLLSLDPRVSALHADAQQVREARAQQEVERRDEILRRIRALDDARREAARASEARRADAAARRAEADAALQERRAVLRDTVRRQ